MFKLLHKLSRILKFVFSRKFVVVILLALQLFILFGAFFVLAEYYRFINMIFLAISLVLVIHILNRNENPAYKIAWQKMNVFPRPLLGKNMTAVKRSGAHV